ncbi:hypothetical protein GQ53DRAFT_85711 [Thozetella sp. PMI_491]|nr:hypothetical protein GQ53DRAFT_85711 [Thozetella sp. PMI_491]
MQWSDMRTHEGDEQKPAKVSPIRNPFSAHRGGSARVAWSMTPTGRKSPKKGGETRGRYRYLGLWTVPVPPPLLRIPPLPCSHAPMPLVSFHFIPGVCRYGGTGTEGMHPRPRDTPLEGSSAPRRGVAGIMEKTKKDLRRRQQTHLGPPLPPSLFLLPQRPSCWLLLFVSSSERFAPVPNP